MRVPITLALLLIATGCASSVPQRVSSSSSPASSAPREPKLVTLHTGHRGTVGGAAAVTRDGRVLLVTTGPEGLGNSGFEITRVELWESRDNGVTWLGPRLINRGTRDRVMLTVAMLPLASGKILLLNALFGGVDTEHSDPEKSLLEFHTQTSADNGQTWSAPRRIDETWRYVNAPLAILQLKSGRILVPSGYLTPHKGKSVVSALYSDDEGQTWRRSPGVIDIGGEGWESGPAEPTAVELPDGRVWMLMRTQTGVQWESFSTDGGVTWSPAQPSRFTSSSAPAVFTTLRDGRIVLVWCNSNSAPYARHCLAAAISSDGGQTFTGFREIAKVEPPLDSLERRWGVAYAYPVQAPDGTLLVPFNTGNWQQMSARVARVDPDWIAQRDLVEDFSSGLGAWCEVGATGHTFGANLLGAPGMELSIGRAGGAGGAPGPAGLSRNIPLVRSGTITLTIVPRQGPTYVLLHNSFLAPGKFDAALLRVRFAPDANKAHLAAGTPTQRKSAAERFTPVYSHTAYPVTDEVPYPLDVKANEPCVLRVHVNAAAGVASIRLNDGPEVTRPLPRNTEGICYVAVAAGEGGKIRVQRVEGRGE